MKLSSYFSMMLGVAFPVLAAATEDPLGLTDYTIWEAYGSGDTYHERRLTNHEVEHLRATGAILPDGSISKESNMLHHHALAQGAQVTDSTPSSPAKIQQRPLPTSQQVAQQTGTKPVGHPDSNGTIHVRPTQFPDQPSREDILHMQRDIQHIERTVGKALDLSLSAYAVAELPQATNGRSGVSVGMSTADGHVAEAIGYSSNFGQQHEYTIKIGVSHAGSEDAAGAGFSYEW